MKMRITTVALISLLTTTNICAAQPNKLPRILRELEWGKIRDIDKAQTRALEILIKNPSLSLKLLNCTLDILLFQNTKSASNFPVLTAQIGHIDNAIKFFDKVPGFRQLLIPVIYETCRSLRLPGPWHEISTALKIAYSQPNETVVAFGIPPDYGINIPQGNPHSIITNKRWLECKTVNWGSPLMSAGRKKRNLCRQLIRQQELVALYNQSRDKSLSYEICCEQPITPAWATWLKEHAISYHTKEEIALINNDR